MAPRRNKLRADSGRYLRPSAEWNHGKLLATNLHSRRENLLSEQVAEIDRLDRHAKNLEETNVATRQEFVSTHQEIKKRRKQIRRILKGSGKKIQNELDRIAKMETDINAGERIKKELEEARIQEQYWLAAKHDLASKIQKSSQELEEAQTDVKRLREMRVELDILKEERNQIRMTFDRYKASNIKKAEQMRLMDKNLAEMVKEVKRLRADLLDAQRQPIGED